MSSHTTTHGKWSEPGVPHRGWTWRDVYDLGEPSAICAMCETSEIRYVHCMEHADYADILEVGCICAEHMSQDYVSPGEHEARLKRVAQRHSTWEYKAWHLSRKGNYWLNTEGYNLIIVPWGDGHKIRVTHRKSGRSQLGTRIYATENDAQDGALLALLWAKENL